MKKLIAVILVLLIITIIIIPTLAEAGGDGWKIGGALLGGFLLGSVLGPHDRVIVGPVYPAYPPYPYYPPPIYYPPQVYYPPPVYQPQPVWIPEHYEFQWQTVCEIMYQREHCYPAQITVFIPGHWEYR